MAWVHPPAIGCRFSFLHIPSGRCGHSMCVYSSSLIVFGGYDGHRWLNDLHKFDINSLIWSQPPLSGEPPQPRQYHAGHLLDSSLYIYGGYNGSIWLQDLVVADLSVMRWLYPVTSGAQPTAKEGLAMASINSYLFVHGGWNGVANGDLHRLDTVSYEWTLLRVEGGRPHLCGHSMTAVKDLLFVFGGFNGDTWANTLHTIDPMKDTAWIEPTVFGVPAARGYHSAVLFNKHIIVYAGYNGKYILADIVALDIETLTWFLPDACSGHFPAARNAHTMALHGSQLYLFGGYNGTRDTNELHILETSAFSSLHEDFRRSLLSTYWQDVRLTNSSASRLVHSVLLKSRVPLLYNQLLRNCPAFLETRSGSIDMGPGSLESLKIFCEYIYCDLTRERITREVVEDLLYLSFKYSVTRLKALCLKVIYEVTESIPESSLASDIMKCKDEVQLSDFTVYVKDTAFKVHKIIIAARCQYFRVLLKPGMKDSSRDTIHFHDLDPKAFEIIVEWMYSDKFLPLFTEDSIDLEIGKELLSATNFLHLESLMRITEITLWKLIDKSNAFRMFEIACLFSTSQLKSYCVNFILRQFDRTSIQKELSWLSEDACQELTRYLPRRVTRRSTYNNSTELVNVKYEKEEEDVKNLEPVMVSGQLFESMKATKKMRIKGNKASTSTDSLVTGVLRSSRSSAIICLKSPISLKLKPRMQLNVQGVKAGGASNSKETKNKILDTYRRKHRNYKSQTVVERGMKSVEESVTNKALDTHQRKRRNYKSQTLVERGNRIEEKPEFFIKGFGSCRRGKSRMNSLVTFSNRNIDILSSVGMQIYARTDISSKQLTLPGIKMKFL